MYLYYLLVLLLQQNTWQKQAEELKVHFGSESESAVLLGKA